MSKTDIGYTLLVGLGVILLTVFSYELQPQPPKESAYRTELREMLKRCLAGQDLKDLNCERIERVLNRSIKKGD